jgi:ribonuclease HI
VAKYVIYTDGGSTEDPDVTYIAGRGTYIKNLETEEEILIYAACNPGDTNNRAEMRAWMRAAAFMLEKKMEHVQFYVDSKYVIDGIYRDLPRWVANGWKKADGLPVKNQDLWEEIDEFVHQLRKHNIKFDIQWVKGHSDVYGNEMADTGATLGTALCLAGDFEERIVDPKTLDHVGDAPEAAKKASTYKEPHALLCGRRMIDVVNGEKLTIDDKRVYATVSYDDKDPIKARGLGVLAGDRFEGLVMLPEEDELYEMIREEQHRICDSAIIKPFVFEWDKVKSSRVVKEYKKAGQGILRRQKYNIMFNDNQTVLTRYLDPPRQARRCLESMNDKRMLHQEYIAGNLETVDITDMFFDEGKKGKLTIKPELAKMKSLTYKHKHESGRNANIIMTFDFEIPSRNALAKAYKQDKEIKVSLVFHDKTENTFRWSVIVETGQATGIYNNPSTNLYILP